MTLPSSTSDLVHRVESDVFSSNFINSLFSSTHRIDKLTGLDISAFITSPNLRRLFDNFAAINQSIQAAQDEAKAAQESDDSHHHDSHGDSHHHGSHHHGAHSGNGGQPAEFNTVAPDGRSLPGEDPVNSSQLKWTRTTSVSGQKKTLVTFGFASQFALNGLSSARYRALFVSAMQTWAKHAPVVFQEVEVVGKGKDVDILVQVDNIDGPKGTLAQAYFPRYGDITFDGDEKWSEAVFLETALHELGHSLGLAHEDDVDAILNSKLANRFADLDPFLFPDDIEGIQRLYGAGSGSVITLDDGALDILPDEANDSPNLVVNGSFENASLRAQRYRTTSEIEGWQSIGDRVFQLDRRTKKLGNAADGSTWVELDARQGNATFGQNVDTVTGQAYTLSVDFTDGGRPTATTRVQVFWEGELVDTLTGGSKGRWRSFEYDVVGSKRNVSTLAFRAIGKADYTGGFIDNVQLVAQPGRSSLTQSLVTDDYALGGADKKSESSSDFDALATQFDVTTVLPDPFGAADSSGLG